MGLKEGLLRVSFNIFCVLSSNKEINSDLFEVYCCWNTAQLFVKHYWWYYMPQSMHKVLIHSYQVIRTKNLLIGMFSEEAQESRNKGFRSFRESFLTKISRKPTNMDLLTRLLCSLDPSISSLRRIVDDKRELELPEDAKSLLAV